MKTKLLTLLIALLSTSAVALAQHTPFLQAGIKAGTNISITEKKENEISVEFNSLNKKTITSTWQAIPYTQSDSVTLQWYLHFKLRWYPWEKFGSLLYEKSYGQQMETGLQNLKNSVQ